MASHAPSTAPGHFAQSPIIIREPDWIEDPSLWLWCPSLAETSKQQHILFASGWPKNLSFDPHWLTNSRIFRGDISLENGRLARPLTEVLPYQDAARWDGRMRHNPRVVSHAGKSYLYYTGTTFAGSTPCPSKPADWNDPRTLEAHRNQRIGLAVADSPDGTWNPLPRPILDVAQKGWDSYLVSNPSPLILPSGETYLLYKGVSKLWSTIRLGMAKAPSPSGPFERLSEDPIHFTPALEGSIEDPFLYEFEGQFRMLFKDVSGAITGEEGAGAQAVSDDGITWHLMSPPRAYSRGYFGRQGAWTPLGSLERPSFFESSDHRHWFVAAASRGGNGFWEAEASGCLIAPLSITSGRETDAMETAVAL